MFLAISYTWPKNRTPFAAFADITCQRQEWHLAIRGYTTLGINRFYLTKGRIQFPRKVDRSTMTDWGQNSIYIQSNDSRRRSWQLRQLLTYWWGWMVLPPWTVTWGWAPLKHRTDIFVLLYVYTCHSAMTYTCYQMNTSAHMFVTQHALFHRQQGTSELYAWKKEKKRKTEWNRDSESSSSSSIP